MMSLHGSEKRIDKDMDCQQVQKALGMINENETFVSFVSYHHCQMKEVYLQKIKFVHFKPKMKSFDSREGLESSFRNGN